MIQGTHPWGVLDLLDTEIAPGTPTPVRIALGEYFTGPIEYVGLIHVADPTSDTQTSWRNLRIFESEPAPIANDDQFVVTEDSLENLLDVLANDVSIDPLATTSIDLAIVEFSPPTRGGTLRLSDDNRDLVYIPAPDFTGVEVFRYQMSDGHATSEAWVRVTVDNRNDPPTAVNDTFYVEPNSGRQLLDVLANDSGAPDLNEQLLVTAVTAGSAGGTTQHDFFTRVRYTPPTDFVGSESFRYTLYDGTPDSHDEGRAVVHVGLRAEISFDATPPASYGTPRFDTRGEFLLEDDGNTLHLLGDTARSVPFGYDIQPTTVLEFLFRATDATTGFQAIAFDTDMEPSSDRTLIVQGNTDGFGTPVAAPELNEDGWQVWRVPIGEYFTGLVNRIAFINSDENGTSTATFGQVRIYDRQSHIVAADTVPTAVVFSPLRQRRNGRGLSWS